MATLPTLTLCDDLVTVLTAAATPGPKDSYQREYFVRHADAEDPELKVGDGRKVTIAPSNPNAYSYEPATRGEDNYTHRVSVLIEKRCVDAGDVARDWLDTEVNWVYTNIVLGFDWDFRTGAIPTFNRNLVTISADVKLFDIDDLLSRGKLFSSQVDLVFNELVDV